MASSGSRRASSAFALTLLAALAAAAAALFASPGSATRGIQPFSETPGTGQAVIFSPQGKLYGQLIELVHKKLEEQNYTVTEYLDTVPDADPENAKAATFVNLSQKGVAVVISHGDADQLLVEWYDTPAARDAKLAFYQGGGVFAAGDLAACDSNALLPKLQWFGICITRQGIVKHFTDKNTIVHVAACGSFGLAGSFNAREYFGYSTCAVDPNDVRKDTKLVWGRMHGKEDNGFHRAARVAWEAKGFSSDAFQYQHKKGLDDTVLSPGVLLVKPEDGARITAPTVLQGNLAFDTRMNTAIDPATVLTVDPGGCASIGGRTWFTPYSIVFTLFVSGIGTATFRVHATPTLAEGLNATSGMHFQNNLDGNQDPHSSDHEGPNRDDFIWSIRCVRP